MQRVLSKYILREPLDATMWRADIEFAVHPRHARRSGYFAFNRRSGHAKTLFSNRIPVDRVRTRRLAACDCTDSVLQADESDLRRQERDRRKVRRQLCGQRVGAYVEPDIAMVDREQRQRYIDVI